MLKTRQFGSTSLRVSEIGFGAWGIGGPAMAGTVPLGWGDVDEATSIRALEVAREQGITLIDTADFYGVGHSEELIGKVFGNRPDVVIATKVGHGLQTDGSIWTDYSKVHILQACEASLKRLRRDRIEIYQLHSARLPQLMEGACVEAMEQLRHQGKILHWGLSLNTFQPAPEAEYMIERKIGQSFQLVLNAMNQRAVPILQKASESGYGIIARMPLQFGLLTGKFTRESRFSERDHRSFRLAPDLLDRSLTFFDQYIQPFAQLHHMTPTALALSFCLSFPEVSTVIPGIKTPEQAFENTEGITPLPQADRNDFLRRLARASGDLVSLMEKRG